MLRVIVFDFDGVIVDSNALKHNAFFKLFPAASEQEIVKEVMRSIGDKTRFKILEQIFRRLEQPADQIESLVMQYAGKYNEIVQLGILEKGFAPGALAALKNLSTGYNLYINSATPEFALQESLRRLDLKRFFKASFGRFSADDPKESNLRKIMEAEKVSGAKVLMVGDSEADYQAAQRCGCLFLGIANDFNNWQQTSFPLLPDLTELQKTINTLQ